MLAALVLTTRFALELGALASLGRLGARRGRTAGARLVLGLGAAASVAFLTSGGPLPSRR